MRPALLLLVVLATASCTPVQSASVSVGATRYQGVELDSGIEVFRGIPFALPPTGERRWRKPEPLEPPRGSVDATRFAPACLQTSSGVDWYHHLMRKVEADPAQFPAPVYSEDCLYLNVWTDLSAAPERPVIVYIHGGSNTGGWSYEPNYRGAALADQGVVLVSVAYRLGAFGFLSHPELPDRNFALHDLALALHWVKDHIAAFGGDPGRITLMGESAGAANASHVMVSPLSAGLAKRLIHQSGGWQFDGLADPAEAESRGLALERTLVPAEGGLDVMRQSSAKSVLEAAAAVYEDYYFSPVPDSSSLPAALGELADRGSLPPFDVLLGTNADEALMYLEADDTVRGWLAENLEPGQRATVTDELDPTKTDREQLNRLRTAAQFACPSMRLASAAARAGGRSFVYQFTRVRDGFETVGAYHGAELPYVFDTHDEWLPTRAGDRELTAKMVDYWLSFAANGTPESDGTASWPRWQEDSQRVLVLGDTLAEQAFPDFALCRALAGVSR